jgi:hypothetical protein
MVLERTVRAKDDLDWLPPSFKAIRWTVAGTLWTGMVGVLGASLAFLKPGFFIMGKGIAVLFAGGYYAGDRAAKAVLRARLKALAHGQVDLTRLQRAEDGELVHVRGRVKAERVLSGVLSDERAVYRRLVFNVSGERWVHEAAEDFRLVDETGETAIVEVQGARLIVPEPKQQRVEGDVAQRVIALTVDPNQELRMLARFRYGDRGNSISAGELLVREGDEVEIVGYKTRSVDQRVTERLARDTPLRATLKGGRGLPLLVAPTRRA